MQNSPVLKWNEFNGRVIYNQGRKNYDWYLTTPLSRWIAPIVWKRQRICLGRGTNISNISENVLQPTPIHNYKVKAYRLWRPEIVEKLLNIVGFFWGYQKSSSIFEARGRQGGVVVEVESWSFTIPLIQNFDRFLGLQTYAFCWGLEKRNFLELNLDWCMIINFCPCSASFCNPKGPVQNPEEQLEASASWFYHNSRATSAP